METAIRKAIESGYKLFFVIEPDELEPAIRFYIHGMEWTKVTSDPKFWQALGKSLGWNIKHFTKNRRQATNHRGSRDCNKFCGREWLMNWYSFIDHLAEGKDPEDFFNNLLK